MQDYLKWLVLPLFAVALLAGCMATGEGVDPEAPILPLVDVAQRKAELSALPPDIREQWCRRSYASALLQRRATTTGPIMYQRSNAQHAGDVLLRNVEGYYAGSDRAAKTIRDMLEEGARIGAFTILAPYAPREFPGYNTMNEPVMQVANFMVALAHAYLVLQEEYPDDTVLLANVRQWGNRLFQVSSQANDDFVGIARGADRRALNAAGWASWGNVANNRAALSLAYRYYMHALNSIGRGGTDQVWLHQVPRDRVGSRLFFSNITVGPALVAAHALNRSGAGDVYTAAPGGGTIVEGAAWLWNMVHTDQPLELLHARNTGARGIGWAELFLHEFPAHPLASNVDGWLAPRRPFYLEMGGGPTTCLYHDIPPQS